MGPPGVNVGDSIALHDGDAPEVRPGGHEVDCPDPLAVAVAEVKGLKTRARPEKHVNVNPDEVEVDDLEGGEGVEAEGEAEGNPGQVADEETREVRTTPREGERRDQAHEVIGDIDVEVLDAAGGGVVDEALGSPDAGFCGAPVPFYDEGEAVEAPEAAALER